MKRGALLLLSLVLNLWSWQKDGVPIATGPGDQVGVQVGVDQSGDLLVAWTDQNAWPVVRIYAQKVSGETGARLWGAGGVPVCTVDTISGRKGDLAAVVTGSGSLMCAWWDARSGVDTDVYLQRVSSGGVLQYQAGGIPVCTVPQNQQGLKLCLDATGEGCYVAWTDYRSGDADVWAARVTAEGQVTWEERITRNMADASPLSILPSGDGVLVVWNGRRPSDSLYAYSVFAQKLAADGGFLLDTSGVRIERNARVARAVSDARGGAIVLFQSPVSPSYEWCVQKVDSSGQICYAPGGVVVIKGLWDPMCTTYSTPSVWESYGFTGDGQGGSVLTGQKYYSGMTFNGLLLTGRVDSAGMVVWPEAGVKVWEEEEPAGASYHAHSRAIEDRTGGGCIIAWDTDSDSTVGDILTARVAADGEFRWRVPISEAVGTQRSPVLAGQAAGAVVCWEDARGSDIDIYAQYIDSLGQVGIVEETPPRQRCDRKITAHPPCFSSHVRLDMNFANSIAAVLTIHDATGRLTRVWHLDPRKEADCSIVWDGRDSAERKVSRGVYFCTITAADRSASCKVVCIR